MTAVNRLPTVPREALHQVAKILPRLGSNHDGEVVASVRAIERVLRSAGADLNDLAAVLITPTTNRSTRNEGDLLADCLAAIGLFNEREARFLRSVGRLLDAGHDLSAKQVMWLRDLHRIAITGFTREGAAA